MVIDAVSRTLTFSLKKSSIRSSTVHAQVSVNINFFYQGSLCLEWFSKETVLKDTNEMNKSKVRKMEDFAFLISVKKLRNQAS